MKATRNLFHALIIWLALTVTGFDLHAGKEPLYEGLGSYSRNIPTDSPEAQRYFDKGLAFVRDSFRKKILSAITVVRRFLEL